MPTPKAKPTAIPTGSQILSLVAAINAAPIPAPKAKPKPIYIPELFFII